MFLPTIKSTTTRIDINPHLSPINSMKLLRNVHTNQHSKTDRQLMTISLVVRGVSLSAIGGGCSPIRDVLVAIFGVGEGNSEWQSL